MTQTATIDTTNESAKLAGSRVNDAVRSGVESARNLAKDAVAKGAAVAEHQGAQVTDPARRAGESVQTTLALVNRGGTDLAAFWLKVMQDQTAQNIEAMRRLAGAQTWEEKLAVQSSFLTGSLARMQDVFTRYIELTGTMTGDMLTARTGKVDKAD
jgi:hypothetical protein